MRKERDLSRLKPRDAYKIWLRYCGVSITGHGQGNIYNRFPNWP